ncbi:MAG: sugar phosphate isomerase/epimerase [Planctomycetota bacterium]|jgi:sugar phosphate isomerase/epimerase|nr:sugar phosphate isomerase/epimerase [Planctomycetales bacterium]RLT04286.1 MAG: sugar phosphate isomerase/epimerase [Planctomycetota bacterium]
MIKSAITVSIVEQARKGPFVFHDDVADACRIASELGFDAVELFAPSAAAIQSLPLADLLKRHHLRLAAVGTGAGMVVHKLQLCDPDSARRQKAEHFIRDIMSAGAEFGGPAIIGSMQGKWDDVVDQPTAQGYLRDALQRLGEYAESLGTTLIYEPLNRYETNLANTLQQGLELLKPLATNSVKLLADLFHMNIEEVSVADALQNAGAQIGHVHFVDSNRQAAGRGHMDFAPIAAALASIGYDGYASAEAFPIPDSLTTARQTSETFRRYFRS